LEIAPELTSVSLEFKGFREMIRPLPGKAATRHEIGVLNAISDRVRGAARPGSVPTRTLLRQQIAELEAFLANNPDSAYGADLRRQLARYYRSIGRYSFSLDRWQAALNETLPFAEGFGKEIADESLAERMSLLASLGRADELQQIKDQMRGRRLDGGFRTMQFRNALESLAMMRRRPEISFRCGPFAVAEVAQRLTGNWVSGISGAESPETGFSAYELVRLNPFGGWENRGSIFGSTIDLTFTSPSTVRRFAWRSGTKVGRRRLWEVTDPSGKCSCPCGSRPG